MPGSSHASAALRTRLAQALGLRQLPVAVWDELVRRGWLEDMNAESAGFEALCDEAEATLAAFESYAQATHRWAAGLDAVLSPVPSTAEAQPGEGMEPFAAGHESTLSEAEGERAWAVSVYLAACAATDPAVRALRAVPFPSEPLSEAEAYGFIQSPATARLPRWRFLEEQLPLVHHATLVRDDLQRGADDFKVSSTLHLEPPGVEVEWHTWTREARAGFTTRVEYPGQDGWRHIVVAQEDSVLGEVGALSQTLAHRYQWQPAQATWFLLTGVTPMVPVLTASTSIAEDRQHGSHRLTVTAAAWISAGTVAQLYQHLQRQALGHPRLRPVGPRTLALVHFVAAHLDDAQTLGPSSRLLEEWNRRYPEWRIADRRRLHRDLMRAVRSVCFEYPSRPEVGQAPRAAPPG